MTFTIAQLLEMPSVLNRLSNEKLPAKIAFRLRSITAQLAPHLNAADETRVSLIKKYGVQKDDTIHVPDENMAAFNEEFVPLVQETVEVDIQPVSIESLGDILVSPRELDVLGTLITE